MAIQNNLLPERGLFVFSYQNVEFCRCDPFRPVGAGGAFHSRKQIRSKYEMDTSIGGPRSFQQTRCVFTTLLVWSRRKYIGQGAPRPQRNRCEQSVSSFSLKVWLQADCAHNVGNMGYARVGGVCRCTFGSSLWESPRKLCRPRGVYFWPALQLNANSTGKIILCCPA